MENYDISDAKIRSPHWISEPKFARLNGDSAWCTTRQSYLQIDLTKTYKLTAIATQGGTGLNRWVKRYKVGFNVGSIPVIYSETGSQKVRIERSALALRCRVPDIFLRHGGQRAKFFEAEAFHYCKKSKTPAGRNLMLRK